MFSLKLSDLVGCSLMMPGIITGVHTVMRPDASRVIALIMVSEFRTYVMYLSQMNSETIAIEIEEAETLPPATGDRARAAHKKSLDLKSNL